jgi:outer membrane protein assembly factor BamB
MAMGVADSTPAGTRQDVRPLFTRRARGDTSARMRALAALLLLAAVASASARREACTDGRFLTPDGRHLVAEVTAPASETIVLDVTSIAIEPACARVEYKPRTTRMGRIIRAVWTECDGVAGPVKLRALQPARDCNRLKGTLTVKGPRPKRRKVRATRAPYQYDVALDPTSPWPKFRRTSRQDGRSPVVPTLAGGHLWTFQTGKGIFSTPVVDGDGTIYVGSADRTFYAIRADGTLAWSRLTGEIIDSSALLDDRGRIYFGSGDGHLYALDRTTGDEVWTFAADTPATLGFGLINWFEGNVAIGGDGTLFVPNDNFLTYALARDDASERWRFKTNDQTWSLPAVDPATGRLYIANNVIFGANTFALDASTGASVWSAGTKGSIPASPLLTADGRVVVGGFDGFVRAYDAATGAVEWQFGARDHVYGSPGELPDGTIVQPSADGSVYGLDPASGAIRWQFDTRDAIRSSPAIDGDGNTYVGAGDGRLYVINPDGTLRWAMQLIDSSRDDLNASSALGADAIVIAGESGQVFSIPYDYCLRPEGVADARCRPGSAGEDLPSDGAALFFTTQFGKQLDVAPAAIEPNQPLTFSLFVRKNGDTVLAHLDTPSMMVTLDPPVAARVEVSGDRKFLTVVPLAPWGPKTGGGLGVTITGDYLVNPTRDGLKFSGGTVGGALDQTFTFAVNAVAADDALPLPVPAAPGDPSGVWEFYRIAVPLPTVLPSYNQIGFDSLHYLVGLVEGGAPGLAIAWVVGAKLAEGSNTTVVDPATKVLFPLEVVNDGGAVTFTNESLFAIEFNGIRLPFQFFRFATRIDTQGNALASPALNVSALCAGITFYGPFLQQLGFCNPSTDVLAVFGGAELRPFGTGVQAAPAGVGSVAFDADAAGVTVTLTDSTIRPDQHSVGLLLLDDATGEPVALDYGFETTRTTAPDGTIASVGIAFGSVTPPGSVRAYLMVDAYPAARATLPVP